MTWANMLLVLLLTGQVGVIGNPPPALHHPEKAVREPEKEAPSTIPSASASDTTPKSPTIPPTSEMGKTPKPQDTPQEDPLLDAKKPRETGENLNATPIAPPATSIEPPATNTPPLKTAPPVRTKNQVQELIAAALVLNQNGGVTGQPWQLSQAIAASQDRKQQLPIIHSYWQLTEAVAKCHFAAEQVKQLEQLQGSPADEAPLRAARAAAAATLRDSELALLTAQHDLATLVLLPADSPLPLPADKPHVGGYRTNYQALFAMRSPPPIARVIDRTLPIRLTAIEERSAAVVAAQDAYLAVTESYHANQTDVSGVLSAGDQLLHERRALMETVCRYNHDIAEYAMAVLGPNITSQQLVEVLIEPARSSTDSGMLEKSSDIQPAQYLEPQSPSGQQAPREIVPSQTVPLQRQVPGQPTPAVRPMKDRPTPASRDTRPQSTQVDRTPAIDHSSHKLIVDQSGTPPSLSSEPAATVSSDVVDKSGISGIRNSNPPDAIAAPPKHNDSIPNNSTALFPALREAAPPVRAKQLTLALHWDRSLPESSNKPMSLSECLAREGGANRRETLAVYWIARQRAAEFQAIAQEAELLDNLSSPALERSQQPAGPNEMLYLRAARLSTKAALEEARAALVESQYELAIRTQSMAEKSWPLSSTTPHSGSYDLNLAAQTRQLAESRPILRLSAAIPDQGISVQEHATAVVEADAARAADVEAYLSGTKPLTAVLQATAFETRQTFAFLQTLTDYNRLIADFALIVLPSNLPADKLASALVVQP